ncbi:MAG TPA: HypC/HybG/HupF family hydrogenase formation chaperone [Gemmata sp.]|nr:HypC/HybG/HupF family hydrogenase formation chaperone [Gemmata sp.]
MWLALATSWLLQQLGKSATIRLQQLQSSSMCLAIPGKVVEVYHDLLMGRLDFGGVLQRVCLEYVPEIAAGDYALVHVGFAQSRLDDSEARRVLELLAEAGELDHIQPEGGDEVP